MKRDTKHVVVVGAGQAGLAASYHLSNRAIDHAVLERGRVGETWRSQRWDSFYLNTTNALSALPGMPYEGDEPEGFMHRDEFAAYLSEYTTQFDLPVRTGVEVTKLSRDNGGFLLETSDGAIRARALILASGNQNSPRVPALASKLAERVTQLHTADYRGPDQLPKGGVMIVGSGQSGCQIAEDLLEKGRVVWMSTSKVGRIPRRYRGRDLFTWGQMGGFWDQTVADLEKPELRYQRQPQISGTRGGHTVSFQQLVREGARLVGRLVEVDSEMLRFSPDLAENARAGDEASAGFKRMVDGFIERSRIETPPPEDDPAEAPEAALFESSRADINLEAEGIATLIWCTGFGGDFGWMEGNVELDRHGEPLHDGGLNTTTQGVYFLGVPWQRKRKSGLIIGADEDAKYVIDHLQKTIL